MFVRRNSLLSIFLLLASLSSAERPPRVDERFAFYERDRDAIVNLVQREMKLSSKEDVEEYVDHQFGRRMLQRVVEVDGRVVGVAFYEMRDDHIDLRFMAVDPKYQDLASAKLVDRIKSQLSHSSGRDFLLADVAEDNTALLTAFQKGGLRPTTEQPLSGYTRVVLRKDDASMNPDKLQTKSYFDRLDVPMNASAEQIRSALAKIKTHFSLNPKSAQLLEEASKVLSSPEERQQYISTHVTELTKVAVRGNQIKPNAVSFYDVLGISVNQRRPDVLKHALERATVLLAKDPVSLAKVKKAYDVLSDKDQRAIYDTILQTTDGADQQHALKRFANLVPSSAPAPIEKSPEESVPDLYARLGIPKNTAQLAVIDRFIDAMKKNKGDSYALEKIREAYGVLSNPKLRQRYDIFVQDRPSNVVSLVDGLIQQGKAPSPASKEKIRYPRRDVMTSDPFSENLYAVLGVPENASSDTIYEAFVNESRKYDPNSPEKLNLSKAVRILADFQRRRKYDEYSRSPTQSDEWMGNRINALLLSGAPPEKPNNPPGVLGGPDALTGDLYARLGASPNMSFEKIEGLFLGLAGKYAKGEISQTAFDRYLDAFSVLKDTDTREQYDHEATDGGMTLRKSEPIVVQARERREAQYLKAFLNKVDDKTTLEEFINQTYDRLGAIVASPKLAEKYLRAFSAKAKNAAPSELTGKVVSMLQDLNNFLPTNEHFETARKTLQKINQTISSSNGNCDFSPLS